MGKWKGKDSLAVLTLGWPLRQDSSIGVDEHIDLIASSPSSSSSSQNQASLSSCKEGEKKGDTDISLHVSAPHDNCLSSLILLFPLRNGRDTTAGCLGNPARSHAPRIRTKAYAPSGMMGLVVRVWALWSVNPMSSAPSTLVGEDRADRLAIDRDSAHSRPASP